MIHLVVYIYCNIPNCKDSTGLLLGSTNWVVILERIQYHIGARESKLSLRHFDISKAWSRLIRLRPPKLNKYLPNFRTHGHWIVRASCRVLEPACFGAAPAPGIFIRLRLRLQVKKNIILEFYKTDYELSKIRSNTCTSTCRSYFMFTLEKTSNDVKFHVIFVNY